MGGFQVTRVPILQVENPLIIRLFYIILKNKPLFFIIFYTTELISLVHHPSSMSSLSQIPQASSQSLNTSPVGDFNTEEISEAEQALIARAIEISQQQQIAKAYSRKNRLQPKYRKMIPNLKMKKSNQKCTICLEKFCEGEIIKMMPCSHILHRDCAKQWYKMNKTCPICRMDLELHFINLSQKKQQGIKTDLSADELKN